jgi:diguanylate cyclase (GGDEF)-like protein
MTTSTSQYSTIEMRLAVLNDIWNRYVAAGQFDLFVEFAVSVNSLAEFFNRMKISGLMRLCEGLEISALEKLGDEKIHPLTQREIVALQRQIDALAGAVAVANSRKLAVDRREQKKQEIEWIKPRTVWVVGSSGQQHLIQELQFFGFKVIELDSATQTLLAEAPLTEAPLAVLFFAEKNLLLKEIEQIIAIRKYCAASELIYLTDHATFEHLVELMRAGIDTTVPTNNVGAVINYLHDLVQTQEQEQYRVLVVEDSQVAITAIRRTLHQHKIDSLVLGDPRHLLTALDSYRPDLILMDMHLPNMTGVDATRVLRQIERYSAIPIVYLSGESDAAMQVEALRLGGDQFIHKPFNPILLAAVVKTRIERHREAQRTTRIDRMTGLLNHVSAKLHIESMLVKRDPGLLTIAMIDIDHFKSINDTYGHPIGDQVIRGLAWFLKGRLRSVDMIARYGGEEFLIALPGVATDQAYTLIDRIRSDFATLPHAHKDGVLHATFSSGIATYPNLDNVKELIEAADNALLNAKREGRNCVKTDQHQK